MQQTNNSRLRREFERTPVRAHAFVHNRGGFQRARVVDYSASGLQLDRTFGLVKRDSIQIEFISGARVRSCVAWSLGAKTGVIFSQALPQTHPAMLELTRRTANRSLERA
jgi:PilZ domain-containing protein